jgi:thymidine kinase
MNTKKTAGATKNAEKKTRKRGGQVGNKNAEKWTEKAAIDLGNELIDWLCEKPVNYLYEEFLVIVKGLHPCTISYLGKKFESFSKLIKRAEKIQEIKICKYTDNKRINTTMGIFMLKNKHGFTDRQDVTTGGEKLDRKIEIEILK